MTDTAPPFVLADGERSCELDDVRNDPNVLGVHVHPDAAARLCSRHVTRLSCEATKDSKVGEEFSRDVPNVAEAALERLDPEGVIAAGVQVGPGDILVGRIQSVILELSPEEKLLRSIFGEMAGARDTSLRCPPGLKGVTSAAERTDSKSSSKVELDITDVRPLRIGDVLELDGEQVVVSAIEDVAGDMIWAGNAGAMTVRKVVCAEDQHHARSIGPYSLVTQQPLSGKAQFGGQVVTGAQLAALEAGGAWHAAHEMLTVKSNDVSGRTRLYESIVRGDVSAAAGVPEGAKVLLRELFALGLDAVSDGETAPAKPASGLKKSASGMIIQSLSVRPEEELPGLRLTLLSAERIRELSFGEVKKPETIDHRTFKPVVDGLFCARIFGPIKDYECMCGKYKYMKHRGVVCEKCGVEVIQSRVRRERFGHIELPVPLLHPWAVPALAKAIGRSTDDIRKIVREQLTLDLQEPAESRDYGVWALREAAGDNLHFFVDLWPVLPPDLRPIVPLAGGRFATSDLNDLYRRLINRANRMRRLVELNAPAIIIRNEHRELQQALGQLVQNGRDGAPVMADKRKLHSLMDVVDGHFAGAAEGKRVDYSASAAVVPHDLPDRAILLPRVMALELFKPWIYSRLAALGYVSTIKTAKRLVERDDPLVHEALAQGVTEHPVLAIAPNVVAGFDVRLWDELAIGLSAAAMHALELRGGDVLTVHVPATPQAIRETRALRPHRAGDAAPPSGWVARTADATDRPAVLYAAALAGELDPLSDRDARYLMGKLGPDADSSVDTQEPAWTRADPNQSPAAPSSEHFDRRVDELEMSVGTANVLQAANILTSAHLVQKTDVDLLRTRQCGRTELKEIKEILSALGFLLGMKL